MNNEYRAIINTQFKMNVNTPIPISSFSTTYNFMKHPPAPRSFCQGLAGKHGFMILTLRVRCGRRCESAK